MKSILFIHQSAELYGSDKTILMFISSLDKTKYNPIVVLPFDGPLTREFEKNQIKVVIAPVLKLYRKMFTPKNLLLFFKEYREGMRALNQLHKEHNFQLVYSHTLAALIGILFARKNHIKHLWHVQEILARPKIINKSFRMLLGLQANHKAVYDSKATMNFWIADEPALAAKSDFVWNGLDVNDKPIHTAYEIENVRKNYFACSGNETIIGLVGRINSWKGQPLLLDAFSQIAANNPDARLVFIGSAPINQDFFVDDLNASIKALNLTDKVRIIPFQQNIWQFWDALDIAVVPSTEPEPFGMVAIEAMLAKKPVIAANHGGLTEIVVPGETGLLFEPGNSQSLAKSLQTLLDDATLRTRFGESGYKRACANFSLESHVKKFEHIFEEIIP